MIELTRTVDQDQNAVWIAEHALDGGAALVMVGPLLEVVSPSKVNNPQWIEIAAHASHGARVLRTRLHGPFASIDDAEAAAAVLRMISPPHCTGPNKVSRAPRRVVQRGTGQIYESVRQTSIQAHVDISALRKHLNRQPGFKSVKGREFVYYDELPKDQQLTVERLNEELQKQ